MIVAIALLSLLFEPTILESTFSYPANSRTDLIEEPALRPVPHVAGINFTKHDLYLVAVG
jgi:hypothetical protein